LAGGQWTVPPDESDELRDKLDNVKRLMALEQALIKLICSDSLFDRRGTGSSDPPIVLTSDACQRTGIGVIKTFRHKGLKKLFQDGDCFKMVIAAESMRAFLIASRMHFPCLIPPPGLKIWISLDTDCTS